MDINQLALEYQTLCSKLKDSIQYDERLDSTACTFCPNHPSNGGSGNCNCTLGDIKITC